jgi:predicted glutamine amidotransferase
VLYSVGALWAYAERNTHDPATFSPEQKLLYMFSKSAERIRYESDTHPDGLGVSVFEDEDEEASK